MISPKALSTLDEQVNMGWYKRRPNPLMQAVQVTHSNPRRVAEWILSQGGAVVALSVVDTGPVNRRMLRISTAYELMDAPVTWWVMIDDERTVTVASDQTFQATFVQVGGPAPGSS